MELTSILQSSQQTVENLSSRNELTRDQFLSILIEQLKSQDPLDPMDNQAFLDQMVGLQTLESSTSLAANFALLLAHSELAAGSNLIGREIVGIADDGEVIEGTVDRVLVGEEGVRLVVGGRMIAMDNVQEVRAPLGDTSGDTQ